MSENCCECGRCFSEASTPEPAGEICAECYTPPPCEACGGSGMLLGSPALDSELFNMLRVERCDACERFTDDDDAAKALHAAYRGHDREPLAC